MKIAVAYGHSPNCIGAVGYMNEVRKMMELAPYLIKHLRNAGHTVLEIKSTEKTENKDLAYRVKKANDWKADLYIDLHMNSFNKTAKGFEVLIYDSRHKDVVQKANAICENFKKLGFVNRGIKHRPDLYVLRNTTMKAILPEIGFCDNKSDCDLINKLGLDKIALNIANGIDPKIKEKKTETRYLVEVRGMTDPKRQQLIIDFLKANKFNYKAEEYEVEI